MGTTKQTQVMKNDVPFAAERRTMIEAQLRRRGLRDERVLEAMYALPRHEFVPAACVHAAYDDCPLPLGDGQTISQPYIVAAMTHAVRVQPGDRALEVGTGSGYQAAILTILGAKVYTLERNSRLAAEARARLARLGFETVEVIEGDGSEGYTPAAPYQVIMVTAAAPEVPAALLAQLAEGGRMVIPVGSLYHQDLQLIFKHGNETATKYLDPCQFVPLIGKQGWSEKDFW